MKPIYRKGKILNADLYQRLMRLDAKIFPGCNNEFKPNREWWVKVNRGEIVAYCGCLYSEGVCIFVRAWVSPEFRGKGLQRLMIAKRLNAAKSNRCECAITYCTYDNIPSANNLIKSGFLLYTPAYKYAGDMLYFKLAL